MIGTYQFMVCALNGEKTKQEETKMDEKKMSALFIAMGYLESTLENEHKTHSNEVVEYARKVLNIMNRELKKD